MLEIKFIKKLFFAIFMTLLFSGCVNDMYYAGMEKVGFHKRDIMVDRIQNVQDNQKDTQEEFKSALEQFGALVKLENTELKDTYDKFNTKFEDSKKAAEDLNTSISKLEDVSVALFEEWNEELNLYSNAKLKAQSKAKLNSTKQSYNKMLSAMKASQKSIEPILSSFQDNVLMLKHSLNAQAIGALKSEFSNLQSDINVLINSMNKSINESNTFIQKMK